MYPVRLIYILRTVLQFSVFVVQFRRHRLSFALWLGLRYDPRANYRELSDHSDLNSCLESKL
jgi:hypothetical protein